MNRLVSLGPPVARLGALTDLDVSGNPLTDPPPAIVKQGTQAILATLRARHPARCVTVEGGGLTASSGVTAGVQQTFDVVLLAPGADGNANLTPNDLLIDFAYVGDLAPGACVFFL